MFELVETDPDSKARLGRLTMAHGVVDSPVFMPVGANQQRQRAAALQDAGATVVAPERTGPRKSGKSQKQWSIALKPA